MRNIIDALAVVIAFFALLAMVNANDKYADLVAGVGYCNVNMGSTTATLACNRISRIESGL